jgi:hypothetical protein
MIGVCTAVIGDVAAQLGCFIYLKDSVNAIAFVALGTSVPGTAETAENFRAKNDAFLWHKGLTTGPIQSRALLLKQKYVSSSANPDLRRYAM